MTTTAAIWLLLVFGAGPNQPPVTPIGDFPTQQACLVVASSVHTNVPGARWACVQVRKA